MEQFTRDSTDTPVAMPAPHTIAPAAGTPQVPRAVPGGDDGVLQQFVRSECNSRLGSSLGPAPPDGGPPWRLKWRADVSASVQPSVLLAAGGRIVVYGMAAWQLFDLQGRPILMGPLGASGVALDPERSLFYALDLYGLVAARNLSDGKQAFTMSLNQPSKSMTRLIQRHGLRLITVGSEMPKDAHKEDPQYSIAEVTDVRDLQSRKSWTDPGGPAVIQELSAKTMRMLPAMHDDSLVLALRDGVYILDTALEVRRALTGSFVPATLSLDEAGRIYLLAQADNALSLWLLQPDGQRLYACQMPPGNFRLLGPPIIGYDHVVYLVSERHIFAIGEDGKLNWSREANGPVAGAAVTADDQLLTSEGSQVAAWDAKGQRRVVFTFPEELRTAPVLTAAGELLAAGRASLFCAGR